MSHQELMNSMKKQFRSQEFPTEGLSKAELENSLIRMLSRCWHRGIAIFMLDILVCAVSDQVEGPNSIDLACPELRHTPVFNRIRGDITSATFIPRPCPTLC